MQSWYYRVPLKLIGYEHVNRRPCHAPALCNGDETSWISNWPSYITWLTILWSSPYHLFIVTYLAVVFPNGDSIGTMNYLIFTPMLMCNLLCITVRRSCEHALRWESSVWHCNRNEREWVLGVPGTKCVCTSDYCNGGPSLVKASTLLSTIVPIVLIIAHCLS